MKPDAFVKVRLDIGKNKWGCLVSPENWEKFGSEFEALAKRLHFHGEFPKPIYGDKREDGIYG